MRGETGHEQEERLEIKKKQKRIAAKAVSNSTGKVTTIPFGDDDDDHNAIIRFQRTDTLLPKESSPVGRASGACRCGRKQPAPSTLGFAEEFRSSPWPRGSTSP